MEPESSSPYPQVPATCPYPEPTPSSPHDPLQLPEDPSKPEVATAVYKLLMMGMRMPETCWAVFKRRAINLRDWCIWLFDLFESKTLDFVLAICKIYFGIAKSHVTVSRLRLSLQWRNVKPFSCNWHSRAHRHNAQYISSHQQFLISDSANIHWCQFHYRKADVIKGNMSRIPDYGSLLRPAASTGSEQTGVWNMRPAICMRLASRSLAVLSLLSFWL
jgi:hypothetical protein